MPVPRTIEWIGELHDGCVRMIDQTLLPGQLQMLDCRDSSCVFEAIQSLRVRGAPAIGIAGAMGLVLGVRAAARAADGANDGADGAQTAAWFETLHEQQRYLASSRPTAVNLFWGLDRLVNLAERLRGQQSVGEICAALFAEAKAIRDEDAASCRAIGDCGAAVIPAGGGVLTHCNAGGLATAEWGTALATMYAAHEQGKRFTVFADETRPLLQGSRLTAWELGQAGIEVITICDSMAAQVMREGRVHCVVTGADRIAANGDVANKIGTYGVAVLARAHDIPFYVAAPASTFDLNCPSGADIPIEQRAADEIRAVCGQATAPDDAAVYNPAFDVTPAEYVRGLITDRGRIEPVTAENIAAIIATPS